MDLHISSTIHKIINLYPFLSLQDYDYDGEIDEKSYKLIGNKLFLSCFANTYLTPNYTVIQEEEVLGDKDEFFKLSNVPDINIFGHTSKENFSFDISSSQCTLSGYGYAIVIIDIETLNLLKTYYFISDISCPPRLISSSPSYITFSFEQILYVLDLKKGITDNFYLIRGGLCSSYGNFLIIFSEDYYDVSESISVVDLDDMTEYILADELKEHSITEVAEWNTYLDLEKDILHIEDRNSNSILEIKVSELANRCDEQVDLSEQDDEDDEIVLGCFSESIDDIDINYFS